MAVTNNIEGRYVDLRSCTVDDADFTRAIRKDPEFVRFLPAIDNTIEEQKCWISAQRNKQGDYFFVVWDKEDNRIGTISIYAIKDGHAESGRLAIKGTNPFQALEAQMLIFRFAFRELGLKCIDGFIYEDNERALRFNKQFGGKHYPPELNEEGKSIIRFEIWNTDYESVDKKLSSIIYRERK